ncbi:MAG: ATP-binding cassette domain-containing protein [Vicinamibacterales bacterium]|nr:ATP-binding cassette domain-containing protein [Vicinamibacterales bacterium]
MPAPEVRPAEVPAVEFEGVSLAFDDQVVLQNLSLTVPAAQLTVILGASGSGKSVMLRLMMGLMKPDSGIIRINGERIDSMHEQDLMRVRRDIGMLFQESALFDSLTVADNVGYRLYEDAAMPEDAIRQRVEDVLGFIGLEEHVDKMPSELSGGQRRRVAIARAIASKPRIVLFDSPTSGLDPITSKTVDAEVIKLRDLEGVTAVMVTHQYEDAFYVANHEATRQDGQVRIDPATASEAATATFLMLKDGAIYFRGTAGELQSSKDPYLRKFLS